MEVVYHKNVTKVKFFSENHEKRFHSALEQDLKRDKQKRHPAGCHFCGYYCF